MRSGVVVMRSMAARRGIRVIVAVLGVWVAWGLGFRGIF